LNRFFPFYQVHHRPLFPTPACFFLRQFFSPKRRFGPVAVMTLVHSPRLFSPSPQPKNTHPIPPTSFFCANGSPGSFLWVCRPCCFLHHVSFSFPLPFSVSSPSLFCCVLFFSHGLQDSVLLLFEHSAVGRVLFGLSAFSHFFRRSTTISKTPAYSPLVPPVSVGGWSCFLLFSRTNAPRSGATFAS